MKYYHKYQKALEAHGYRVDEYGYVWDSNGNQSAGEDNYGNVQSKDPNVTRICQEAHAEMDKPKPAPKAKPKVKEVQEIVPAVDAKGNRIKDDPATEVDESYAVKTVKKVIH